MELKELEKNYISLTKKFNNNTISDEEIKKLYEIERKIEQFYNY